MNDHGGLQPALEAVLLAADDPVDHHRLAQAVGHPPEEVYAGLCELSDEYDEQRRGFQLREISTGWRLMTREECAPAVENFVRNDRQEKLSQAALETLAIAAYQQPVTRSRIAEIRGVSVDAVVRNLTTRGLLDETGHDPHSGAILYVTSDQFLEAMGLTGLDELPEIAPLVPAVDEVSQIEQDDGGG